jgi:hypothetical protein
MPDWYLPEDEKTVQAINHNDLIIDVPLFDFQVRSVRHLNRYS